MTRTYLSLIVFSLLLGGCSLFPNKTDEKNINLSDNIKMTDTTPSPSSNTTPSQSGETVVSLQTKDGEILIKLYADITPNTVKTFLTKANSGFYNNLTFHRVISGFMAQGGDPTGTGTGGNRQKSEINATPFVRGSLGLARSADTKEYSNDSQFFICFTTDGCRHLTGEYVNFGEVISGLDILDKIKQGDLIINLTSLAK